MTIQHAEVDGVPVVICRGPELEESSRESMGIKWCFACRTRAEFEWVVKSPVIDWNDEASIAAAMWGPVIFAECGNCHRRDTQLFPGWEYKWKE